MIRRKNASTYLVHSSINGVYLYDPYKTLNYELYWGLEWNLSTRVGLFFTIFVEGEIGYAPPIYVMWQRKKKKPLDTGR